MPHATITGIDINPDAIAQARRADPSALSHYLVAGQLDPGERYDAILALAVFRHGLIEATSPECCGGILSFARFADGVARLDQCLEPDGWLALYNGHFRFADTCTAERYAVDAFRMTDHPPMTLLYGSDDLLIEGASDDEVLFRKLK